MTSDTDQLLPNHTASHRRWQQASHTPASKQQGLNEIIFGILLVILLCSSITKGAQLPSKNLSLQEIHLVRCLTYISHRYFAPGRTVVISSPADYRDVQQELIAEIQHTFTWSVVVNVDGNIIKPNETDFIDRDGSYIILLPVKYLKKFVVEINGMVKDGTIFRRLWNSEVRFIVAGTNEFSMSQQREIFDSLSKLRIYNCIIVSREHYDIDKECSRQINVNNVDTRMKLGVYTWFPYQSSDRCIEVNDITLMDSWVISGQGHFTKNTDLFPGKISKNLNRCPLKALIRNRVSESFTNYVKRTYPNGSVVWYVEGLEYKLIRVILRQMNMTFFHVPTPEEEGWKNNFVISLFEKDSFIALGGFAKDTFLNSHFDLTSSYYFTSSRWYVPCSVKYPRWSSIYRILSVELWLVLIISIFIAAISTTLVGRYSCTSEWQVYKTLTSSLTNVWAAILRVSVSTIPRTPSLRSLFLAWVCFSLTFSTVFQAYLTTFLIESGYESPIQNMDELLASGIKLADLPGDSFIIENNNETETSKLLKNRVDCPSYEDCINWIRYQKNISFILPELVAEAYYVNGSFVGENSESLMCKLEDGVFLQSGSTMVMFPGDPLKRRVNEIIDRVVEAGIYKFWISLRMNLRKLYSRKIAIVHPSDGYYNFNIYHMKPAFYLLLIGWCLSAPCFIVELMYYRVLGKRK